MGVRKTWNPSAWEEGRNDQELKASVQYLVQATLSLF